MKMVLVLASILALNVSYADKVVAGDSLAVVNKSDNTISVIDIATSTIVNTLPTGKGPHELIGSPNSKWIVSTDFVGGDSLTVFDAQAQKVVTTIALPNLPSPHGIQFLADNKHVIFTSGKAGKVGIADVVSGKVVSNISTNQDTTHMLALSGNQSLAFTTNIGSNSVSVLDMSKGAKIKDIKTQAMPEAIAYRHVGNELWYGANKEGKVVVIDPSTEATIASWDGFSFPYRIMFNHDQSVAIVPDFRNHYVRFFDTQTKQEIGKLMLEEGAGPQGITLHPRKDIAYLSLNLKDKVVAIDIATQGIVAEYPTGKNPDGIVFIPTGE